MRIIVGVSPYICCAKARKLWDPIGSNVIALITDHSHIVFIQGSLGITLKNHDQSLSCNLYGDKGNDTAFLFELVIISYLLFPTCLYR